MSPDTWVTPTPWDIERIAERRALVDIARAALGAPAASRLCASGHWHTITSFDANYLPYSLN